MAALALRGLTKRYGERPAVDRLDLEIPAGSLFALLGPSGCGKTTTLRLIAGLTAPDAGSITIDGQEITGLATERRGIAMVFQQPTLFPHMDVAANVGFGLAVRGVAAAETSAEVERLLAVVQLAGFGRRYPAQLSGGQQSRVAIARALLARPRVLLMDEPFASLEPPLREELRRFLRDLQRQLGLTVLFVTHDQAEAFELADRLGVMLAGRLAQVGPPETVFRQPATEAVARFLGAANIIDGAAVRPEDIVLGRGPLTGRIERAAFQGAVTLYDVRVGAQLLRVAAASSHAVGDTIAVDIPADKLRRFTAP